MEEMKRQKGDMMIVYCSPVVAIYNRYMMIVYCSPVVAIYNIVMIGDDAGDDADDW